MIRSIINRESRRRERSTRTNALAVHYRSQDAARNFQNHREQIRRDIEAAKLKTNPRSRRGNEAQTTTGSAPIPNDHARPPKFLMVPTGIP